MAEQREHIEFNWRFYIYTKSFLEAGNLHAYVQNLQGLEAHIRAKYRYPRTQSMWFRLYKDDTLVTDINTIEYDFNNQNRETLLTDLKDCVDNKSVRIYFS